MKKKLSASMQGTPKLSGKRCLCTACGEYFSRERIFSRHRVGEYNQERRCLTRGEMTARGWRRNCDGLWIMEPLQRAGLARVRTYHGGGATHAAPKRKTPKSPNAGKVRV
jgi:hypothetical protein